jgi:drug/metabolite transporter (DMT)-like permease
VGTAVLSALVPFFWKAPDRLAHWLILSVLGVLGALGHYCVARALLWGPAALISPFHYIQLVWAAAVGYLVFGDVPGLWTWAGAAIIVASGCYIALGETRARRR